MTTDGIMRAASKKGWFRVSHRWRDDGLRAKCHRLVREGRLFVMPYWMVSKRLRNDPRAATFFAPVKSDVFT